MVIMYWKPTTNHALLILDEGEIMYHVNYDSKAELLLAYDIQKSDFKTVAVCWLDNSMKAGKVIWIENQNLYRKQEKIRNLLVEINTYLFGFDDKWKQENC